MDSRLLMEIGIDNDGNLLVIDTSPYERWIEDFNEDIHHVVLERVIRYSEDDDKLDIIAENINIPTSYMGYKVDKTYELPSDGLYHYQKIIVPTQDHIGDSLCYYNTSDENLFFIDNGIHIRIDFDTAMDYINDQTTGNAFWFDDYVFSIYNLIKCYVLTEKKRIANWLKNNCKADCDVISTINTNADILMAAVTVLTYLISKRQFVEAYRLLNGLRTCNGLCQDFTEDIKGCGCGKSI